MADSFGHRLYPAEITPLAIRAPANSISTTANWIFNFMVVMVTPPGEPSNLPVEGKERCSDD
jgi:hypothetical protein